MPVRGPGMSGTAPPRQRRRETPDERSHRQVREAQGLPSKGTVPQAEAAAAAPRFDAPNAPKPSGPPIRILQDYGYHGSIFDLNDRLQHVVDAFSSRFGHDPSPGLAFDLIRSPVEDVAKLFGLTPGSSRAARLQGIAKDAPEHDLFTTDSSGALVLAPIKRLLGIPDTVPERPFVGPPAEMREDARRHSARYQAYRKAKVRLAAAQAKLELLNPLGGPDPRDPAYAEAKRAVDAAYQDLQDTVQGTSSPFYQPSAFDPEKGRQLVTAKERYPTAANAAEAGFLPLNSVSLPDFAHALDQLDKLVGQGAITVTENGLTLDQAAKQAERINSDNPAFRAHARNTPTQTVTTIKAAQRELNDRMGTDLPVTGFLNEDWAKAIRNWMHSGDYFHQVATFQSQQAGFGDDYGAFVKAWKFKQHAVKKHGWAQWFVNAMPLHVFSHGGGFGLAHGVFDDIVRPDSLGFSTPLHALTHTGGLALDTVGGSLEQGKAYTAAANELSMALPYFGSGKSFEEARHDAVKQLKLHPSWIRAFFPDQPPEVTDAGWAKIANLVGDLLILRKPALTGERLAAGDLRGALRSKYVGASSKWAYEDLRRGKIGSAASRFEGGSGAERLVARAAPLVKAGELTPDQFRAHVAELFARGQTTLVLRGNEVTVEGPLLASLRSRTLPSPGAAGRGWLKAKDRLRSGLDEIDKALRRSNRQGTTHAADFVSALRSEVAHAVPRSTRSYFDPRLPERVHDFVLREFKDAELANTWESQLIRYRATENVRGIQQLERKLQRAYAKKYPLEREGLKPEDPFAPTVSTEAPSILHFPSGGQREVNTLFDGLHNATRTVDAGLNKLARTHAKIILSGFPFVRLGGGLSLFWKHAIGDTLRRGVAEDGFIFGESAAMKQAAREVKAHADANPEASRLLGSFLARAREGETRWLLGRGAQDARTFRTGEKLGHGNYMDAAGGYLRRMVDDDALAAFRLSSEDDVAPLVNLILNNRTYRGLWKSARRQSGAPTKLKMSEGEARKRLRVLQRKHDRLWDQLLAGNYVTSRGEKAVQAERNLRNSKIRKRGGKPLPTLKSQQRSAIEDQIDAVIGRHENEPWAKQYHAEQDEMNRIREGLGNLSEHRFEVGTVTVGKATSELGERASVLSAEDFAQRIWDRYVGVEEAASAAGVEGIWDQAAQVLREHRGSKANRALGKFIADNRLDFEVKAGQVERVGSFDRITGDYINQIMALNKWNRGQLAERTLYRTWHELKQAGFSDRAALETGTDLAERLVMHHMLDFANRLQIEQDLRWLSYFATKHRLYWKWVVGTFARHPGYAAAVRDIQALLDDRGNLNFELFGQKLAVPAARLVWVPGREYSEVSPLALGLYGLATGGPEGAVNAAKGTFGNILTRSDTAIQLLARVAGMQVGKLPKTYGAALKGLDEQTRARVARAINTYQNEYFHEHGHYAPESEAVKHVLWVAGAEEWWRANMPLPVVPGSGGNEGQKLLRRYMAIIDPDKRREFLDAHPDLALYFGIYKDPAVYLHNRGYWREYLNARDQFRGAREKIYEQAKQDGMSADLREASRKAGDAFADTINRLLLRDAAENGKLSQKGQELLDSGKSLAAFAADEYIVKRGSWGKQMSVDPLLDPRATLHKLFPSIPGAELDRGVPGFSVKEAQHELKLLRDPAFQQTYADAGEEAQSQIKTRIGELLRFIAEFRGYPVDKLGKVQARYQSEHVNPYWHEVERRYAAIKALPRDQQDVAYADFRRWRDEQDHPVTVKGVKFPSPIRMAWASLDPQTRAERLARLGGSSWEHLTDYEKELLGKPASTSQGWNNLVRVIAAFRGQIKLPGITPMQPGQKLAANQLVFLVKYVEHGEKGYLDPTPGFFKDWLFAQEPKYRRLELLRPVKESAHVKQWRHLFADANVLGSHLKDKDYSAGALRDAWRRYVDGPEFQSWLRSTPKGFREELRMYGPDLLNTLLSR